MAAHEIPLTTLAPDVKQAVWAAIKREKPELAHFLKDPNIAFLLKTFNGRLSMKVADLPPSAVEVLREANRSE